MKKSTAILIVGCFVFLLGLGFVIVGFASLGESPEVFEDWATSSSTGVGDSMVVTGKLSEKESLFVGIGGYGYKFEGSVVPFISGENYGNKGDTKTEFGIFEAGPNRDLNLCWIPAIICIIISIILLIYGIKVKRKEPKIPPYYYPPNYPPGTYPYPQYQQYPPAPPPGTKL